LGAAARATAVLAVSAIFATGCFSDQGNVFSLRVGQCFDDPDLEADEVTDVTIIECGEPHDNEVYAVFDAPGSEYPGSEELLAVANAGCLARFTSFVGVTFDLSDLDATFLAPTEQSWNARDDREVICYLFDDDGAELEGSMRGVGR
jgi:hypothetical protein